MENTPKAPKGIIDGYDDEVTPRGGVRFDYAERGYLQAQIYPDRADRLYIEDIHVTEQFRGNGYGTSLFLLAYEYAKANGLQQLEMGIINPNALRMIAEVIPYDDIRLFRDEKDRTEQLAIDLETACELIADLESQAAAYSARGEDFPSDFDPGLHAVISLS